MTWEVVARKDFQDAVRSHWLWALSALFVAVLAFPPALIIADIIQIGQASEGLNTDLFVFLMRDTMTLLVPIIAIVLAYASVTGERDSGTLKLLLSLPHSRRDVVAGKREALSALTDEEVMERIEGALDSTELISGFRDEEVTDRLLGAIVLALRETLGDPIDNEWVTVLPIISLLQREPPRDEGAPASFLPIHGDTSVCLSTVTPRV
jgi:hypothetical protein